MDFVLSDVVPAKQLTGYLLPVTEHFSRPIQPQYRISDTSRKRYKLRNETIAPVSRFFVTANPSCSTIATTDQPSCRHLDSPLNMVSAYLNGYLVGFLDLGMWVDEEPCIDFFVLDTQRPTTDIWMGPSNGEFSVANIFQIILRWIKRVGLFDKRTSGWIRNSQLC